MEEKKIKKISIIPEIIIIIFGILVLWWGYNQYNYYRHALDKDQKRVEIIKSFQLSLEKYKEIKGGYPNDGGQSWAYLTLNETIKGLFDFNSLVDPCGGKITISQTGPNGLAYCSDKEISYSYSGLDCNSDTCNGYIIRLKQQTGGEQTFAPPIKKEGL